ncbi:glutamate--tRNA ligase [Cuniculiplasma divulgatum]|uniref:glutamate--tRNA ligase n=1 Tax=Cuniculiplasma divulgatum TaxID=1673428 RepID=UPI00097E0BCA|nr:glutamate--tRNA ligase [Cuniculiplasma divulgatum]MCI2412322.1 glutamate--tRNA ligase [Cuniculiplasma sp.]WMT49200.1 MAG: glutamate--tRNA ligase [Thermoplasmatales archaeon]
MNSLNTDIEKNVLKNAIEHDGRAELKSVVNKLLGSYPELRSSIKDLMADINLSISKINSMSIEEQISLANEKYSDILIVEKKNEEHHLPDLKNVKGKVVMRMAPSPSGPLHIGHSRMLILNDEYVKRYGGELILRIEDTNPNNIYPQAYDMIQEDTRWLDVNFTQFVIQSERMELYYKRARELILMGKAYICKCRVEDFKRDLMESKACPHRNLPPEMMVEQFDQIITGHDKDLKPVLVIKTDLNHPNPAVRDWIAFRVIETPHPHTGKKYRFYPLMNFSVAVDDHELELTHVIRGMDHLNNTERQKYIFNYFKWDIPEYFHYGLINIQDAILSTTSMRKGIEAGEYRGWDDVRLATLLALRRRGYQKETFRKYWIDSGLNDVNSDFSWEIFNSMNRQFIDHSANRYFFVSDPVKVKINGSPETESMIPLYPKESERGFRKYSLDKDQTLYLQKSDINDAKENDTVRLKDLYNIIYKDGAWHYLDSENKTRRKIIHWVKDDSPEFEVYKPDGTTDRGFIESDAVKANGIVQFERYAFVNKTSERYALYLHK